MNIVIAGAGGLIGSALIKSLLSDGHQITRLSRPGGSTAAGSIMWDPTQGVLEPEALEGFDALINLAGENIGASRWTDEKKQLIYDSRIKTTTLLANRLKSLSRPPKVAVFASAFGIYGSRGDEELTEEMEAIAIKMAQACYDEALDTDGGLFYEAEPDGISIKRKDWWPQAETVVGFLNACQLTGQKHYLEAANKCWQFTMDNIVDKKHGEWFSKAPEKGTRPPDTENKASEWKAPYHNGRACLEIIRRTANLKHIE